jgi:outer membrane autotransporter protein
MKQKKFVQRRTVPRLFTTLFITSMAGTFLPLAHAVEMNWNGAVDSDWSNAGSWDSQAVPSLNDNVTVFNNLGTATVGDSGGNAARLMLRQAEGAKSRPLSMRVWGALNTDSAYIGGKTTLSPRSGPSQVQMLVSRAGVWQNTGTLAVGNAGPSAIELGDSVHSLNEVHLQASDGGSGNESVLDISDGGQVTSGSLRVGVTEETAGTGAVRVKGEASTLTAKSMVVGSQGGTGFLTVAEGGKVLGNSLSLGEDGGSGSVTLYSTNDRSTPEGVFAHSKLTIAAQQSPSGSEQSNNGALIVGNGGSGWLSVNIGEIESETGRVASGKGSSGQVIVGGGGTWTNHRDLRIGEDGTGSLMIGHGGLVTSAAAGDEEVLGGSIGTHANGVGTVEVFEELLGKGQPSNTASLWEIKGKLAVGEEGEGHLTVRDGGWVYNDAGTVAQASGSKGTVDVDGAGSRWVNSGLLTVGDAGAGSMTISNGGLVRAKGVVLAKEAGATGTLNIGAAAGDAATGAGTLDAPTVEFGQGIGKLVFNHTNTDYRFSPVVSGAGSVEVHAGTTQFGDANSYSGGTAIHGGTLVGTATSFGSGAIANDGELVVDQAVKAAFNNALSGKGNFIKRGAGQLDFASDGSGFTGATQVTAGALSVNGSLANSRVTVASGATLKGNGTVGATSILAGGTIAPGNSIGTLTVKGNYTQAAGSTYQAEVDPATLGSSDRILVGGTATLEEGAILNVVKTAPRDYQPGARYDVLKAQGGVKGAYKLTGDTDLSAFIGLRQATTDDGVYLLTFQTKPLAAAAATPNQAAVANAILPAAPIVAPPTAPAVVQPAAPAVVQPTAPAVVQPTAPAAAQPAAPVATRPTATAAAQPATPSAAQVQPARSVLTTALLNQQTDAAARAAFDQLSGDVHASVKGALLDDSRFVRGAALERLRDASSCVSTDNTATTCSASRSTPTVWASTFGSWGHAAQLDRTIGGFAAGADVAVGDTWRLGVMTGYSHSSFQADARHASAKSDDYHLGVYGGSRWGDLSLRLGTAYTRHEIDTTRNVSFSGFSGKPEAQYRASTTQAFGELGYQVQAGAVALEPFANLAYVNLHTNRFNERGGEAALRSSGTDNDATFTTLGLHAQTEWALGGVPVTAKGTLGWQHAFGGTVPNARFSLAGGRSFDIEGTPIARDAALVEAGLNFKVAPQANLSITYAGKFGGHANDQSVRANLAMKF